MLKSRIKIFHRFIVALIVPFFVNSCGIYSFSGNLPGGVKTIAIPVFENQTAEFGIVETLTDEVVSRFTQDNSLKIRDLDAADSVLRGTLIRVEDQPFTVRADESVEEYKVTLHVRLIFENLNDGKIILDESISGFGVYPFGGGSRAQRDEGIEEAIDKLSQDILNKTVSGW